MAPATFAPPVFLSGSPWWTPRRWWELDRWHNRGKHRTRLLPAQPLRCGRPVRTCEQTVVDGCETGTFPGMVEPSPLVVTHREVSMASFDSGAGALAHLRALGCLSLQLGLLHRKQGRQRPTGLKPQCPEAIG